MESGFLELVDCNRRIGDGLAIAEPLYVHPTDLAHQDDSLLDGWLASLTPDQFEHILKSLALPRPARAATAS
jgi:hypothetical protein